MMKEERKPKSFCVSLWVRVFFGCWVGSFSFSPKQNYKTQFFESKAGKATLDHYHTQKKGKKQYKSTVQMHLYLRIFSPT